MKRILLAALAAASIAAPAAASHFLNLDVPYDSRGECEAAIAEFNRGDRDRLLATFPQFFESLGDVESFLHRAFSCELDPAVGQWFIRDGRTAVLSSEWYLRRHD